MPTAISCPGDACNYAFYNQTHNNSRQWCSMARCGRQPGHAVCLSSAATSRNRCRQLLGFKDQRCAGSRNAGGAAVRTTSTPSPTAMWPGDA
ncbi:MAG: CGNR zinc finger domain-containing protein [Chloroflexi bacterium]|nr:CGNR zinc finger domain-containing protein [Chloroflexota bacterium]MBV9133168.1 CGNR zinc finger domain-containing protein [Chloroflexota bacterium]MBV9896626.1 CGNR zinc finger domain-containing protein [Chloroflexota bacterium]